MSRIKKPYERMTEGESVRAFCDSLRKAELAAGEMAAELLDEEWMTIAKTLEAMRINGYKLSRMKSMTRMDQLRALQIKSDAMNSTNLNPLRKK